MLRIELAALSAQELKRLHDVARARRQDSLAAQFRAELEARPSRIEDVRPEPLVVPHPDDPEDELEAQPRSRRTVMMAATAALAAFVSAAVTWGLVLPALSHKQAATEATPSPRAAVALASSAAPASVAPVSYETVEPLVDELTPARPAPTRIAPTRPARTPVRVARAAPKPQAKPAPTNPCASLSAAAARLVCGNPSLAVQDRELRAAYDRAKVAGADAKALDSAQATWRAASDHVTDPKALGDLYARRIQELNAAAQKAKDLDPPF